MSVREFKDVRKARRRGRGLPVDEFMAELEALQARARDRRRTGCGSGWPTARCSLEYLKRFCKEYYFLGVWYTSEFGSLVSNAPDIDALRIGDSEHFDHWIQNLADETGFAGDRNHVDMKVEWARMLGISDEELLAYPPLPETIGVVFTSLLLHAPVLRGGAGRLRLGG